MVSKIVFFCLFTLFVANTSIFSQARNVTLVESNEQYLIVDIVFDSLTVIQKNLKNTWMSEISLPGCSYLHQPGRPRLPLVNLMFAIPENSAPVAILQKENSVTQTVSNIEIIPDEDSSYSSDVTGWFPGAVFKAGIDGYVRDVRIYQLSIFPVRYLAEKNLAQFVKSLQIKIEFNRRSVSSSQYVTSIDQTSRFENVYKSLVINYQDSKKWRTAKNQVYTLNKTMSMNNEFVNIYLQDDGLYSVNGQELIDSGVDLASVELITLSLSNKGKSVPIMIEGAADGTFDPEDQIIFIGKHNEGDNSYYSQFSDTNVYVLSWGENQGLRFSDLNCTPGENEKVMDYARTVQHLEEDLRYERLVRFANEDDDHWLWELYEQGNSYNKQITLPGYRQGSQFLLQAGFQGLTINSKVENNHHIAVKINGQSVGEVFGKNQNPFVFSANCANKASQTFNLQFEIPFSDLDQIFLNWIRFEYDRQLLIDKNQLTCRLEPNAAYRIKGFQSNKIYMLTENGYRLTFPNLTSTPNGNDVTLVYRSSFLATLYTCDHQNLKKVDTIKLVKPSDLLNPSHGADYLVITHSQFSEQAHRLANYRATSGYRTFVADVDDIYNEFGYGQFDPQSIKLFLKYVYNNWQKPAPLYVVLFGDASYNMNKRKNKNDLYKNYIPSKMMYTVSAGMTSSDNYYVAINGDDELPDMFIGRLPAHSVEEADILVNKIIDNETRDIAAEWRRHVALAAGNDEFFTHSAQYVVDHYLPKSMVTHRLSTDFTSPYYQTTEDLINWINSGQSIINFLVHGASEQVADAKLLTKNDLVRLNNKDKYSFAVTMTCYIAHFDHPNEMSLGERLLKEPDKGVMALFGSAGRAYLYSDFYFNNSLFEGIFKHNLRSLGEITTYAKYGLIANADGFWDPVINFVLLGDPAAQLMLPEDDINLNLSKQVLAEGDLLNVSGSVQGSSGGTIEFSVLNSQDSVVTSKHIDVDDNNFATDLFIMDNQTRKRWDESGGPGAVRAYYSNGTKHAASAVTFSVERPILKRFETIPKNPKSYDPVYFIVEIDPEIANQVGGINELLINWSTDKTNWKNIGMEKSENNSWKTGGPLIQEEGTVVYYQLSISTGNGKISITDIRDYRVLYKPDLLVESVAKLAQSSPNMLELTIKNRGESDAGDFVVKVVVKDKKTPQKEWSDNFHVSALSAKSDSILYVPIYDIKAGQYDISLSIDPENVVAEEEESNNTATTSLFVITPHQGSNGIFEFYNYLSCKVEKNSVTKTTSIHVQKAADTDTMQNNILKSVPLDKSKNPSVFHMECADTSISFLQPIEVNFELNFDDTLVSRVINNETVKVFIYKGQQSWQGIPSSVNKLERTVTALLPVSSQTFGLFACFDVTPPTIHFGVQGQNFVDGDVVNSAPTFTIDFEDSIGLDLSSNLIILDDRQVDASECRMSPVDNLNRQVKVIFTPELTAGDHTFKIQASDINANISIKEVSFKTTSEFGLEFIANHPNPFISETTFAFLLTDMANKVTLDIFTTSGRLVNSFEFFDIAGYHEIYWDGLDEDGEEIANGVYYLKFSAQKENKRIEKIEKLAKLQ